MIEFAFTYIIKDTIVLDSILQMFSNSNVQLYLLAYLIGGVPFGLILAKIFGKTDIRQEGSKNIGATNVLRVLKKSNPTLAKKLAVFTVLFDALKGLVLIIIAYALNLDASIQWTIGVMAVIGHCFSPYLKFEGGKGVATAAGVLAWFLPLEVLIAAIVWFGLGKSIKVSSVASLGAVFALVIASYLLHYDMPDIKTHAPIFIIVIIIFYKHIPNIVRLFDGKEKQVV